MVIAFVGFLYAWYAQAKIQRDIADDARKPTQAISETDEGYAFPVQRSLDYYATPNRYSMQASINGALLWAFPLLFLLGLLLLVLGCLGSKKSIPDYENDTNLMKVDDETPVDSS